MVDGRRHEMGEEVEGLEERGLGGGKESADGDRMSLRCVEQANI